MSAGNSPRVSVVMPVRNMDRYLAEAVTSIQEQQYRDFELIIVDFGSTDHSLEIASEVAKSDSRIVLHQISASSLVEARNAGASVARGTYVGVQDADDLSLPIRLQLEVEYLDSHPDVGIVGGRSEWIDSSGKRLLILPHIPIDEEEIRLTLPRHFPFSHTSLLIRKDALDRVGGYRKVMVQSHDYDLALRIAELYRCANIPEIVVQYRVHPSQVSVSRRRMQSYCKLAAQASAIARKSGQPDPLNDVEKIGPPILNKLGISESQIQRELASGYEGWIRPLEIAGEIHAACNVAHEVLQSRWTHLERTEAANLLLLVAQLYWKQRKVLQALLVTARIIIIYPPMLRRFIKAFGKRLRGMAERIA